MISLIIILLIATIWDGFTTIYGTLLILPDGSLQTVAALLFSGIILGFVLNTRRILKWRISFNGILLRFLWFVAVCYDFYTSWIANTDIIILDQGTIAMMIVVVGLTIFTTGSPLLLSALWDRKFQKDEQDREQVKGYS